MARGIKDCDARLATYRTALEAGPDPALVGRWIVEVQAERATAERANGQAQGQRLTKDEVEALVATLGDTVAALQQADPVDKAQAYRELGINLTYHPNGTVGSRRPGRGQASRVLRSVSERRHSPTPRSGSDLRKHRSDRVGGATRALTPRAAALEGDYRAGA